MITLKQVLAISSLTLLSVATQSAYAALPNCQSASSDSDGDGYGWENNASCLVVADTGSTAGTGSANIAASNGTPSCALANSDSDGDGYGWENGATCLVNGGTSTSTGSSSTGSAAVSAERATCTNASSDPDGDGYGWENGATCLVGASTDSNTGSGTGIISSDETNSAVDNGIQETDTATSNPVNNGGGSTPDSDDSPVNSVSSLQFVSPNTFTVNTSGGARYHTEQVGDFLLQQNAWNLESAAPGYDWSQSISTNTNNVPVSWTYDWGPGIPGANGRASDDFNVRSYPELIFGIKDEFRTSATKAEIGFPVRVDNMPTIRIDYGYNAPEFGASRTVNASVTSRFPNGSTIQGERNVAVESFLYESVNGVCDDSLPVTRSNGSNHVYEVMVWLNSGAERLPSGSRDYVTTISLRGASYDVFTKSNDEHYIAFVATDPQTSGTVYWNDYVDWARENAHRVTSRFGANVNSVQIQDSWCVANIIIGTEIFWGAGNFDLHEWTITQSE